MIVYLLTLGVGDCRLLLMMLHTLLLVLWMSPQLKLGRQGQLQHISLFKVFFFIPENQLPVSVKVLFSVHFIWLLFFQKETWVPKFPRSVTPCQSFRQSWYFSKIKQRENLYNPNNYFLFRNCKAIPKGFINTTSHARFTLGSEYGSIVVDYRYDRYSPILSLCCFTHWMNGKSQHRILLVTTSKLNLNP